MPPELLRGTRKCMRIRESRTNKTRHPASMELDCASPMGEDVRVRSSEERRREPRRQVTYPVTVVGPNGDSGLPGDETMIEDINSRGVFFHLSKALPLDRIVHLSIAVPPVGHWMQKVIQIRAEGRVVRSSPTMSDEQRFATAVEFVRPLTLRFEGSYVS